MRRQFLHNGNPTDRVDETTLPAFPIPDSQAIEEVATALGVAPATVTVVVTDTPAAPTVTIPPAVQPAPAATPARVDATALQAFVTANPDPAAWTNAQLRDALIRLVRNELRRHGIA